MAVINVDLTALENKIGKLRALRDTCESISIRSLDVEGARDSISQLSNVDNEYEQIHLTMLTLIDNSIVFLKI